MTQGKTPWEVEAEIYGAIGGYGMAQGRKRNSTINQMAAATDKGGTKKDASPECGSLASGAPLGDQMDGEGRRGETRLPTIQQALQKKGGKKRAQAPSTEL